MHRTVPRVSIIMPVWNGEIFLAAAIQSVLTQTMSDLELIIVDDGSSDRTSAILDRCSDPRILRLWQPNQGQSVARNLGLSKALAPLIAFLDADDCWRPQCLASHCEVLDSRPEIDLTFVRCRYIDHQSQPIGITQHSGTLQHIQPQDILTRCPIWTPSAVCIRRSILDACQTAGGLQLAHTFDPDVRYGEDTDLWFRLVLKAGARLHGIDRVLTHYRLNRSGSMTARQQLDGHHTDYFGALWARVESLDPIQYRRLYARAWAYHWRTMCQKGILFRRTDSLPLRYLYRALLTDSRLLKEEPIPTLLNAGAAHALWLLPPGLSHPALDLAQTLFGRRSKTGLDEP